ncbi:hypothetical protein HO133_002009 [Letharia lupina]|uniref:Uncharacterized protein n=1 Tax=Letharia lupina TaxID=560253 RepID=A0A8H6CD27_9LECA|nr:uncharacterized protein HO133_002009 [Letharia lupina]KAF6221155.1 hypothetical protein HO133_002009 [Letharia lupina]
MKLPSFVVLACIAALSCAPTCSASPKDREARRPPLAQRIGARDFVNLSFPLTEAPLLEPSITVPNGSPTPTCQTYSPCNLFYQWVTIFYWPTEPQNTACLALLPSPPTSANPSGIPVMSPSIYAVFPSIMASDGCNQIGQGYGPITTSFAPGELSTIDIDGDSTNVFNFADLPCGPSTMEVRPGTPYAPSIALPSFIRDLDPAFATCIPGRNQGVDPPIACTADGGPQGPGSPGGGHPRRDLGAHAHPHTAPWAATKTAGPMHKGLL